MSQIHKWTVPVDGGTHLIGGGEIVLVASQYGRTDEVQVWTWEFPGHPGEDKKRTVTVVGTGQELPLRSRPIGSVVVAGGHLVWHVVVIYPEETGTQGYSKGPKPWEG